LIGLLRGTILGKQPPRLLLDVQGVGYELEAPMTTFYDLPAVGGEVTLFTHLAVREDAHTLYGFAKLSDRDLFRSLLRVNGVGAKLALTILSGMDGQAFARCVQEGDSAALVRLPGVGKKTAERLIIELRDRLDAVPAMADAPAAAAGGGAPVPANPVEDAVNALVGLGYKPQEASRMVRAVNAAELSSEEIIRQALQATVQ
jgi:Holliday junction DNA helicase RuvA